MPISPNPTAAPLSIPRPARRRAWLLAACLAAVLPAGAFAQGQPLPLIRPADTPREDYSTRMLIGSDRIVVGLEATGSPRDLGPDRLVVHLSAGSPESVCVSIRSIDGRYRGTFHFAVPGPRPRTVMLDVRSWLYPAQRAAYTPDRLAVGAWLAPLCTPPPGTFVVAVRTSGERGGALRLSLNADAGLQVRADFLAPGRPLPGTRCPLLDVEDAHAFNRVCQVQLPTTPGRYDLGLTLRVPGQEPQLVRYTVLVP